MKVAAAVPAAPKRHGHSHNHTPLGASLAPLLRELCRWAEEHLADVRAAASTTARTA